MRRKLLFAALVLAAGVVSANDTRINIDAGVSFADQRDKVMAELRDGETYAEISDKDREVVVSTLGRMGQTLDAGGAAATVATLNPEQRVALLNDQQLVNNILNQAGEDSRVVCRREAPVGTRMAKTQCLTVAERRRRREEAQRNVDAHSRGHQGLITN